MIAPANNQIELLTELMRVMRPPYWILYVLLVPRTDAAPGRYQVPQSVQGEVAVNFLRRFSEFLESDARHHVWVGAEDSPDLLVYDNHNVIYAYGELPKFEEILNRAGMRKTESVVFPCPHSHCYNVKFDNDEEAVLRYWDWKHFPLQDSDDR